MAAEERRSLLPGPFISRLPQRFPRRRLPPARRGGRHPHDSPGTVCLGPEVLRAGNGISIPRRFPWSPSLEGSAGPARGARRWPGKDAAGPALSRQTQAHRFPPAETPTAPPAGRAPSAGAGAPPRGCRSSPRRRLAAQGQVRQGRNRRRGRGPGPPRPRARGDGRQRGRQPASLTGLAGGSGTRVPRGAGGQAWGRRPVSREGRRSCSFLHGRREGAGGQPVSLTRGRREGVGPRPWRRRRLRRAGPGHPRLPPGAARGRAGSGGLGREAGVSLAGRPLPFPPLSTAEPGYGRSGRGLAGGGSAPQPAALPGGREGERRPGPRRGGRRRSRARSRPPPLPAAERSRPASPSGKPGSAARAARPRLASPARQAGPGVPPGGTGNPAASRAARRGSAPLTPPGHATACGHPRPGAPGLSGGTVLPRGSGAPGAPPGEGAAGEGGAPRPAGAAARATGARRGAGGRGKGPRRGPGLG